MNERRRSLAPLQSNARSFLASLVPASFIAHRYAFLNMHEIFPGIFTWGSTYADRPWDLNGYAIALTGGTVLIDPPAPEEADWQKLPTPITTVVLTNRDHVRDAPLFRARFETLCDSSATNSSGERPDRAFFRLQKHCLCPAPRRGNGIRVRDAVGDQRLFERLHRRVATWFEYQLGAVRVLRGHHG